MVARPKSASSSVSSGMATGSIAIEFTPMKTVVSPVEKRGGAAEWGGGVLIIMHGRSRMTIDPRIYYAGTEHVGFSPTRQKLLTRSAKRREVLGELHEE